MKVKVEIDEECAEDGDKTDEFIRTIYTHFPNARWAGKKPGVYMISF